VCCSCNYDGRPQNAYSVLVGQLLEKELGGTRKGMKKKSVLELNKITDNIKRNRQITFFGCKETHYQIDFIQSN
jgi:hypothetical protein